MEEKDIEIKWKILALKIVGFKNGVIKPYDSLDFYLKQNIEKSIDFDQEKNEFILGRYETGRMSMSKMVQSINEGKHFEVGFVPLERFSLEDIKEYLKSGVNINQEIKEMTNERYKFQDECEEIKNKLDYSRADLYLTDLQKVVSLKRKIQRERQINILLSFLF